VIHENGYVHLADNANSHVAAEIRRRRARVGHVLTIYTDVALVRFRYGYFHVPLDELEEEEDALKNNPVTKS
jgi:hypothetical protein